MQMYVEVSVKYDIINLYRYNYDKLCRLKIDFKGGLSMFLDKSQMTEEDIKLNFITPAILAHWHNKVTMETRITDGRINIRGNLVTRERPKKADYVLWLNRDKPIAIVEAKDDSHSVSYGLQQAITYAQMMDVPFAYSSNGDGFREHDFLTGQERDLALDEFPSPDELTARWEHNANDGEGISADEKTIVNQPYYSSQNTYDPRYYQRNAVNRTVEAIAKGQKLFLHKQMISGRVKSCRFFCFSLSA